MIVADTVSYSEMYLSFSSSGRWVPGGKCYFAKASKSSDATRRLDFIGSPEPSGHRPSVELAFSSCLKTPYCILQTSCLHRPSYSPASSDL
jgi:hypothetical protein